MARQYRYLSVAVSFQATVVFSRANNMMGKTALNDNRKIILWRHRVVGTMSTNTIKQPSGSPKTTVPLGAYESTAFRKPQCLAR
ncbi:MAG: hypothetical protein CMJ77_15035 [Planctomycetaceae bacterium]|nr:hypothetical protein [Planctomycetaceae bacterium]